MAHARFASALKKVEKELDELEFDEFLCRFIQTHVFESRQGPSKVGGMESREESAEGMGDGGWKIGGK